MTRWTFEDIPDQTGRTALVTGANTGIGLETARMLALQGAHVVLACRDPDRGEAAVRAVRAQSPAGSAELVRLDLSDLDSVAAAARAVAADHARLDLLVNNAGVMVPPLGRTAQGFELQFGTNHLGHFALTGHLLPLLERTAGARVVTVSSVAHRIGRISADDPNWRRRAYSPWGAYGQSKLANLVFALELQRRLTASGSGLRSSAAHPGLSSTGLSRTAGGGVDRLFQGVGTPARDAALPTLRAATDPGAEGGAYWGPGLVFETQGPPVLVGASRRARDPRAGRLLWDLSEELTGVSFAFTAPVDGAS